jgi:hypothetical protein
MKKKKQMRKEDKKKKRKKPKNLHIKNTSEMVREILLIQIRNLASFKIIP